MLKRAPDCKVLILLTISTCLASCSTGAQIPLNLGFERSGVEGFGRPWGWTISATRPGAEATMDSLIRREGQRSLRITGQPANDPERGTRGTQAMRYWVHPRFTWGSPVQIRGWVRSSQLAGEALLAVEAWGGGVLAADTAVAAQSEDSADWIPVEVSIPVDSSTHSIMITAALAGSGTVWFDDLSVISGGRSWQSVPAGAGPDARTMAWLTSQTTPFRTVDASVSGTDDYSDLEAFGTIVGDARVVALGEATHGTSEIFRGKHRLLCYLVEEEGFDVFAIEANQLAVEPINDYVLGGPGDARTLMRAMFRVWNTEEVRELIEWMRGYNVGHPERPVEFVGFDMQDPSIPIDSIAAFLQRVDPSLGPVVGQLYAPYREAWRRTAYPQGTDSTRQSWFDDATEAYGRIAERRDEWLSRSRNPADSAAVYWVVQNANVVRQAALSALRLTFATRDSAMAENLRWALGQRAPDSRVVVWAHDGHISRAEHEWANYWGGGSMGGELARIYGNDYRAFGFLTYRGSYSGASGTDIIDTPLFTAPVGSLEHALHTLGERLDRPLLISDIRNAPEWLREPRLIRMIGYAAEDFGFATQIAVGNQFDAVVFVDETSPSRVLR